jgi:hypothetical protein
MATIRHRIAALLLLASAAAAQAAGGTPREATAALLFSYRVASPDAFDPAYADHLAWHRAHRDHLIWYGWYVIAGARAGTFVNGTFGSRFEAIDRRPDPRGDAANLSVTAARHSEIMKYDVWRLWPEASTAFTLEDRAPTAMVEALELSVAPEQAAAFETLLTRLAAARREPGGLGWTWYRATTGGTHPSYLILIPRPNWASLGDRPQTLGGLAARAYAVDSAQAAALDRMTSTLASELWRYRADLSYFPAPQQ